MGERLQRLRREANLSQADLSKAAEVKLGSLRSWEQDRRLMRSDSIMKIAAALGISTDTLLGYTLPAHQ